MNKQPPKLLDMIAGLIAEPSVSSVNPAYDQGNRRVAELLAEWVEPLGAGTEIVPLPGEPDKANLIASWGSGPGGLVLAGHMDTVPYDEDRWRHDPFRLTEEDQRLYGLGTADMKSFLALAVEAVRHFDTANFRRPLILLATADEESTMKGAQLLVQQQRPKASCAVIGEPTGLRPVRMHKGIFMDAVRLRGQAGHSSDPALGVSALEGMQRVIGALLDWRGKLQQQRDPHFKVPFATMNLGYIHGGDNPNRICGDCELQFDLRPLPGMALEDLRAGLRSILERAVRDSGLELEYRPLFQGIPAMETPADADIVRTAEQLTGHAAEAVAFGTEAPYFNRLGMQTVVLGPGDIDQAHQPDEFLALDRIEPMLKILRRLIERYCLS